MQKIVVALAFAPLLVACAGDSSPPAWSEFMPAEVVSLPYERVEPLPVDYKTVDADGIHLLEISGERHYHPIDQTQYGINMLESWHVNGDPEYLRRSLVNARDIGRRSNEDFLPYTFDFSLHEDPTNTIHAPWYSAMAQGQYMSLVVRLHEATGDQKWRDLADRMFATLSDVQQFDSLPDEPWVTFEDGDRFLWFEEYAGDIEPMRVFNGHIFAMFGLYDYWRLTGSEQAAELFARGAETVEHYAPQLRVPGEPSRYGIRLDDPETQTAFYHTIHISQLRDLARLTGSEVFTAIASEFEADVR